MRGNNARSDQLIDQINKPTNGENNSSCYNVPDGLGAPIYNYNTTCASCMVDIDSQLGIESVNTETSCTCTELTPALLAASCCHQERIICAPADASAEHFIVRSTIEGHTAQTLMDTGASSCFISPSFADSLGVPVTTGHPRLIRLGDSSTYKADKELTANTYLGEHQFELKFLIMPLPHGIDVILGLSFMKPNNVWLNALDKRVILGPTADRDQVELLCSLSTTPIPDLTVPSTSSLYKHSQKSAASPPLGCFNLSTDNILSGPADDVWKTLLDQQVLARIAGSRAVLIHGISEVQIQDCSAVRLSKFMQV